MNKEGVPTPFELHRNFIDDRPIMKEDNATLRRLEEFFDEEFLEGKQIIRLVHETLENPSEVDINHLCKEMSDLILVAGSIMELFGRDPEEELRNTVGVNIAVYPAKNFQEGQLHQGILPVTYSLARFQSKQEAKELKIKEDFYGGENHDGEHREVIVFQAEKLPLASEV